MFDFIPTFVVGTICNVSFIWLESILIVEPLLYCCPKIVNVNLSFNNTLLLFNVTIKSVPAGVDGNV